MQLHILTGSYHCSKTSVLLQCYTLFTVGSIYTTFVSTSPEITGWLYLYIWWVEVNVCGPDTVTITLADRSAVKWQVLVERLNENVCTATFKPLNPGHWLIMHFLLSSASSLLVPPGLGHIVIIRKDCKFAPIIQKLTACVLSNVTITTFAGCDVPPVLWLWLNMRLHWQVTKHSRFPAIYITRCLW